MTAPDPQPPARSPRREPVDPLQMSVAEKLACEWEARHDVAARRPVADAAPVQHYLSHLRCADGLHRPAGGRPPAPRTPQAAEEGGTAVPPGLRQWLRWGEDGRPGTPVIPRCC